MTQVLTRMIAVVSLGVAALAFSGCATPAAEQDDAAGAATSETPGQGSTDAQPETPATASAALDFTGTTIDGATFDGASLAGEPAVLWFWAPWCPTCIGQIADVTTLAETYGDEVQFIAVGGLDTAEEIAELTDDIPYVTHLVDVEGEVWRHFGVTAQSTFEVISADGEIISSGYLAPDDLTELVSGLAG